MRGSVLLALFSAVFLTLLSLPASAQATRTWISGVGDDANPCSRTAPCKTFAGAISKTLAGGEIDCLDPGGFGALTITKAISILCHPNSNGGVLVSGTNGIVVAAGSTDRVMLQGLDFEGLSGTGSPGLNGVNVISGLEVIILNCNIRDFATNGVNMSSSTAGARVLIQNSVIANNGTNGSANTGGVNVQGNGVGNTATILNSVVENNQNYSLQVTGSANNAVIANSYFNPTAISSVSGGNIFSFGPSNVVAAGSPTSTVPFK
jgi:hypothetical protein